MSDKFIKIPCEELRANPFSSIGKQWMLVTAGDSEKCNTMTASWGGMGIMWNKNAAFIFIRPQRYTLGFIENSDYFTLSFYDEKYRSALRLCGSKSGRDCDKIKEAGLTPCFDLEAPYFDEAETVLVCKKMYGQYLNAESIIDSSVSSNYTDNDFHKMFIAEIVGAYVRK